MSKAKPKGSKKRRIGVVEPPSLEEIITPPKKPRLETSPEKKPPHGSWSTAEVADFLLTNGLPETVVQKFEEHQIEGRHLLEMTQQDLRSMGIKAVGKQKDILRLLKALQDQTQRDQEKVFNDPIHGHIELHSLMVKIIDTPQFQRLRYIKQLGGTYYVFPGASHNRFEHSIGVGHLAGELVETLQKKQPELSITDKDVLCIKIAGLCHDLGHGPFSHLFDGRFIPKTRPDIKWKHEQASVAMFDHLLSENGLGPEFERFGLTGEDIVFIKEQIAGPLESVMCSQTVSSDWPYQGRPESKSFLYEIVANKRNGIDVDKWDYFSRDCHCLGIPNNFDMKRYMKFARVITVNNRRQLCTRDKEVANLYEMFHTRSSLHRRAYQHKTAKIIEHMICEALVKADDHLLFPGKDRAMKMSEAIYDMHAYTRLTDCVLHQILLSTEPELEESRQLLQKVERRELYKCIGQTQPSNKFSSGIKGQTPLLAQEIISSLDEDDLGDLPRLTVDDILVDVVTFDYGMNDENPIDHMRFYTKDSPQRAVRVRKDQVSQMLPQRFREQHIRVYCKRLDQPSLQAAWEYFIHWCRKQNCITPKAVYKDEEPADTSESDVDETEFIPTPYGTPFGTPVKLEEIPKGLPTPINHEEVVKKLRFSQQ